MFLLRTVRPLAPEITLQLSNIRVAWMDKLTKQFRVLDPGQEDKNEVYALYLHRPRIEEDQSLLQLLRSHSTLANKLKDLGPGKYLVAVKYMSPFNPVFFFKHLMVSHPHHLAADLGHLEDSSMPGAIQFFAQAVALSPQDWTTTEQIYN